MKKYSKEELLNINKTIKKVIIVNLIIFIVLLSLFIYLLIIASRDYSLLFKVLLSLVLFLDGSSVIVCFIMYYHPLYILYRHINNVVSSNSINMTIKVDKIDDLSTITNGIRAYQIYTTVDNNKKILYLNPDFNTLDFDVNSTLKVEVSNNYIKTYEVIDNE